MTNYGINDKFKNSFDTFVVQIAEAIEKYGIPDGYGLVIPLKENPLLIGFQHPENINNKKFQFVETFDDLMKEFKKSNGFMDDGGSGIKCLFKLISPSAWYVLRYAISQKGKLCSLHPNCGVTHNIEINEEYLHFSLYKFSIYGGRGSDVSVAEVCCFNDETPSFFIYRYENEKMVIPTVIEEYESSFIDFLYEVYNYEQINSSSFNNINPSRPNMTLEEVVNLKF